MVHSITTSILETYKLGETFNMVSYYIELTIALFVLMDLALQYCVCLTLKHWLTRWFTWVDILCLLPLVAYSFAPSEQVADMVWRGPDQY